MNYKYLKNHKAYTVISQPFTDWMKAMQVKGYFILRDKVYPASGVINAILKNPRIKVALNPDGDLVIDNYKISKINEPLKNIVKNLLCFKALAYCCSLDRPCANRDLALELLGVSKKSYESVKEELELKLLGIRENGGGLQEQLISGDEEDVKGKVGFDVLEEADLSLFFEPTDPYKDKDTDKIQSNGEPLEFFRAFGRRTAFNKFEDEFCKKCGYRIDEYTRFCPNCGEPR